MTGRLARTIGFLVVACSSPSVAAPGIEATNAVEKKEPPPEIRPYLGEFSYVGGEAERQALRDAVDEVVGDMNILFRGIARDRLLASNKIPTVVLVGASGREVAIAFDDRSYSAPLDGPPVNVVGLDGGTLRLTHRPEAERLFQRFVGAKGGRTNRMGVAEQRLRVQVTVHSTSLPKDLVYSLSFAREP